MSRKKRATTVKVPRAVAPLLRRIGREAQHLGLVAYAVGGCVRDWRLGGMETPDLDVAVETPGDGGGSMAHAPGLRLARVVARALRASVEVHEQFGTASLRWPARRGPKGVARLDVATCRRETYGQPAAYPKVAPGTLEEDLFRRDFTINAMAVSISPARFAALLDPFGGAGDLRARCLRVLHPRSFLDDPSRILRGVRFAQRFDLRWEARTAEYLREAMDAGALGWLNWGRVRRELDRMLEESDPRACLRALAMLGQQIRTDRRSSNAGR